MQAANLCFLLLQYEGKYQSDYSHFLEAQTGYPIISNKGWTFAKDFRTSLSFNVERLTFKNKNDYFLFLAQALLKEGHAIASEITGVEKLVKRFNREWTFAQKGKSSPHSERKAAQIFFNSKHRTHQWLSNFFFSLIYCKDKKVIFGCVETAYKAHMAARLDNKGFQELAQSLEPGKAKKIRTTTTELVKQDKLKTMASLIHLKFSQNEVLQDWLIQTDQELIEHTDNNFWGDGSSDPHERGNGENHLGKILMCERAYLKAFSIMEPVLDDCIDGAEITGE
ncbi:DUF1768-domain containing protein [Candidatus Protochlamydia naegleriophila]|uniref:DUF1768-domain containing protein n=1 Tax=Candidatus Protochlamydia naegleriophila TaxID=389348 RepID=A0A0U5JEM7_9BACT|nr:NADAR family protein [Candidatus Protochlamydia naegleriophila]CUI16214.1 DUF1768-domain containing protein [Candidatus Protochlamydia naegleriophila]